MEQKKLLISAAESVRKWTGNAITAEKLEQEMLRLAVDGGETKATLFEFLYYRRFRANIVLQKKKELSFKRSTTETTLEGSFGLFRFLFWLSSKGRTQRHTTKAKQ